MRSELGLKRIQNFIMSDTEELSVGDFDPSTYQHVLPEGGTRFRRTMTVSMKSSILS